MHGGTDDSPTLAVGTGSSQLLPEGIDPVRLRAAGRLQIGSQLPRDPIGDALDAIQSVDPWVLAAVGGILVLLVLVVLVFRWRRRSPGQRLRSALARLETVAVLTHPNPDPDAMAAAMAVAHLAEHVGTTATIQYPGKIQHQENRALEAVLDLDLERIETSHDLAADDVVLVDHNDPRGFTGSASIDPYAVIDHHPGGGRGLSFTDVRPDYGACATILAEYFEELDADVESGNGGSPDGLVVPTDLATGLMYGIQSDTKRLTSGVSSADFRACEHLYPGIDGEAIERISRPKVEPEVLDVKARAIQNRRVEPPYAVSNVGQLNNVDAIPQSADELITLEAVSTVVVYGCQADTLHISARSRDDRIHVGKALEAAVEGIPMASAGGHARMGGGQVSVQHMEGIGPANGVEIQEFEDLLLDALRGER